MTGPGAKARLEVRGQLGELVVDAPPLNLFDAAMVDALEQAVEEAARRARDGSVRALLLRAEGKVFCAGVDVHEFQGLSRAAGARLMARFLSLVQAVESLPVPTLAVVHGLNLTIGLELSLGCDLLWAAEESRMGLVEATVGLTPGGGGTQRLVARAGVARAAEAVLTGRTYPAQELAAWGVVNRVVPGADLLAQARAEADLLAGGPTLAAAAGKQLLRAARDHGTAAADALTPTVSALPFTTDDLEGGIRSLLEDGPGRAQFIGR